MLVERGKKYVTLSGKEFDLDLLDDDEFKWLRHLEQRSELSGMDYIAFNRSVTAWNHPVYKGRKPAEIAFCPVYKIAEDLGFRLGIRTGEMVAASDPEKTVPESEALNMVKPTGVVSSIVLKVEKIKARIRKGKSHGKLDT